jgi:hypothetical protein
MEKKSRDYCFKHSKMYEGWRCPLCADEEERGTTPAHASQQAGGKTARPGAAAAPAAPAYRPPSRDQSKAKSDQAEAMLLSGAAREALDMCESAVELDAKNIHAHLVGARASRILRDTPREQEFLEDAIKLLRTDEYAKSIQWYHEVLKYTRDGLVLSQLARSFVVARKWPRAETLSMVRSLVGRGAVSDALTVLDSLPVTDRSLLTCAYSMQLTATAFGRKDPDLQAYLQATPASQRGRILAEMLEVQSADVIGGSTISRLRDAVRARYEEWANDIKPLISAEARKVALERIAPKLHAPAMSWAIRFLIGGLVVGVVLGIALGVIGLVLGAVAAAGLAGAGYAYGRDVEAKNLLPSVLPEVREELTEREVERWSSILSDEPVEEAPAEAAAQEPCPYCGAEMATDATTCPSCSRTIEREAPPAEPPAEGTEGEPAPPPASGDPEPSGAV